MILLIDNYDSFTYNLVQAFGKLGEKVLVRMNDRISLDKIGELNPKRIILSPGPGRPEDAGICNSIVKKFHDRVPILGVCLGHQCIAQVFGSRIVKARQLLHGKTSPVYHSGSNLFSHCSNPLVAGRYHSLAIDRVPDNCELTAWDSDQEIMGIKHTTLPVHGIQFHPESFLTPEGESILKAFLYV